MLERSTMNYADSTHPKPEQMPEVGSHWVDHLPLSAESVEIDINNRFPYDENRDTEDIVSALAGEGCPTVAGIEAGLSRFIVLDTRQSEIIHSPFLLLQDDNTGRFKGVWPDEELLVGREHQASRFHDIENDTHMSRAHFSLYYSTENEALTLRDCNSLNKTFVSGNIIDSREKDEGDDRGISANFTYHFIENAIKKRLGSADELAPYGYYHNHPIIGRDSVTVRDGVYGTAFSEQVVVDDKSDILKNAVQEFLLTLSDAPSPTTESRQTLHAVEQQVSRVLRYDFEKTEKMCEPYGEDEKLIDLSEFVTQGIGVCRHQALLSALYIEAAIQRGHLRSGAVSVERNTDIERGSHAWAVYRSGEGDFIIDAAQHFVGTRQQALREGRWRYIVVEGE